MIEVLPPDWLDPARWAQLGATIRRTLDRGLALVDDVVSRGGVLLSAALPGFLGHRLRAALDGLARAAERFAAAVREVLVGFDFPVVALLMSRAWHTQVQEPIRQAGIRAGGPPAAAFGWVGLAGDVYRANLPVQVRALDEVEATVGALRHRLWQTALKTGGLYLGVGTIVGQWVEALAGCAALGATGLGSIPAAIAAATDTAFSTTAILGLSWRLATLAASEARAYLLLAGRLGAGPTFPAGRWPVAVL